MRAEREHSEAVGTDVDPDEEVLNVEESSAKKDDREAMHGYELGPRWQSMPIVFHGSQSIQSAPDTRKHRRNAEPLVVLSKESTRSTFGI